MSSRTLIEYRCDRCHDQLPTSKNNLNIHHDVDSNHRLHVKINLNANASADLCQSCAALLLEFALSQVRQGIRATAGTEYVEAANWNEV